MRYPPISAHQIRPILEAAYQGFHTEYHRDRDPVNWPHRFTDKTDREIAAFFSAILAYGNVTSILNSLKNLFDALGPSPSNGLFKAELAHQLDGFRHRFTRGIDVVIVCHWLRYVLEKHRSIEAYFLSFRRSSTEPMRVTLSKFVEGLHSLALPRPLRTPYTDRKRSIHYLIPNPTLGSSCKRLNLFLRWVVRQADGIDLGLWNAVSPRELLLPIDTHVLRIIRELGWTKSNSARWLTVEEATEQLKLYCPTDPIRYDFSLCHLSMSGFTLKDYYAQME